MSEIIDLEPDKDGVFVPVRRRVKKTKSQSQAAVPVLYHRSQQETVPDVYLLIEDIQFGFRIVNELFNVGSRVVRTLKRMK